MEALGYYRADIQNVDIVELENVLQQAIAAIFWRGERRVDTFDLVQLLIQMVAAVRSINNQAQDNSDEKIQYSLQVSR